MLEKLSQLCMHNIWLITVKVTLVLHTSCYVRPAAVFESLAHGRSASLQEVTWKQACLMAVPFFYPLCLPTLPPPPPRPRPQNIPAMPTKLV